VSHNSNADTGKRLRMRILFYFCPFDRHDFYDMGLTKTQEEADPRKFALRSDPFFALI